MKAFQNACRHRGVQLVEGRGTMRERLHLPVPRVVLRPRRRQHPRPPAGRSPSTTSSRRLDLTAGVRCELWGGAPSINLDDGAPPLRHCLEPAATILDAWKVESLRTEWWYACRLPVNWKLAQEAFQEQYHVVETHPQLVIPGMRYARSDRRVRPAGVRRRRDPLPARR